MRFSARTLRRVAPALICLSAVWWVLLAAEAGAVTVADTFVPQLMAPQAPEPVAPNPANASRRVALIIGNAAYRPRTTPGTTWPALTNPLNDVTLIENAFRADGFEVTPLIDGTHDAMIRGITDFEARAAGAKTVVIYYAGHGFEYAGRNYLVPVDAPVQVSSSELSNRFIDLDQLTSAAVQSRSPYKSVVSPHPQLRAERTPYKLTVMPAPRRWLPAYSGGRHARSGPTISGQSSGMKA